MLKTRERVWQLKSNVRAFAMEYLLLHIS